MTGVQTCALPIFHVAVPPLAEQTRVVAEVERRLSVVERLEAFVSVDLHRAIRVRQSVLHRAFQGRLVSQNPNDEPAETLLQELKNQPAQLPKSGEVFTTKVSKPMRAEPIKTLDQLLKCLDKLGGSAPPLRLLLSTELGDDVETFFDLLREGRNEGRLGVPTGESGVIRRRRHAN